MLIVRRIAAVLLGIAFALSLAIAVFLIRVEQTALNSSFYTDQLRDRGVYEFVMADLLGTAAADFLDTTAADFSGPPLRDSGLTADQIVDSINRELPPARLQELVEPALGSLLQFATAERDQVHVRVDAGPSVRGLLRASLSLLRQGGFYEWVIDVELLPSLREYSADALPEDPDLAVRAAAHLLTPAWLAMTVEETIEPIVAYAIADADGFAIRIHVTDEQADAIAGEIESILLEGTAKDLLHTHVLGPAIAANIDSRGPFPLGAELAPESIATAAIDAAPPDLLEPLISELADDLSDYALGRSQSFQTAIDLTGIKENIGPAIGDLAHAALLQELSQLPECADAAGAAESESLPAQPSSSECRPAGASAQELLNGQHAWAEAALAEELLAAIPDRVSFSENDFRSQIARVGGNAAPASIDDWRELVGGGFTYTDADLRRDLQSTGDLAAFDGFRSFLGSGLVLSASGEPSEGAGAELSTALEPGREASNAVRRSGWLSAVVAAGLLLVAGLLAGRSGPDRLLWASAILLSASAVWLLLLWPAFEIGSSAGRDLAHAEIDKIDAGDFTDTAVLASRFAIDSAGAVASEFLFGMRVALAVLSALAIAGVIGARDWRRRRLECEDRVEH